MNKLKLQLEELTVDSFDTSPAPREKGTVRGAEDPCTCYTNCTCPGCPTCDNTCANTCCNTCDDASCYGRTCEGTCWPACRPSDEETCPAVCITPPN